MGETLVLPGFNDDNMECGGPYPFQDGPRMTLSIFNGRERVNCHLDMENAAILAEFILDRYVKAYQQ